MQDRTTLWSSGGGVQSAAIAVLILTGKLPRPDYSCIVDTEREKQSTWDYLNNTVRPAFIAAGLEIHRIPKSQFATVDLYGKNGDLLLPVFTRQSGELSKLPTYCSNEWKQRVVQRWARSIGLRSVENWIGISADEILCAAKCDKKKPKTEAASFAHVLESRLPNDEQVHPQCKKCIMRIVDGKKFLAAQPDCSIHGTARVDPAAVSLQSSLSSVGK
jgi:hypothetical protein